MKKSSGFTLTELLAVLVVLGLVGLLIFPTIEKTIKDAKNDLYDSQVKNIIDAAKSWVADNPRYLPKNSGEVLTLSLCQLKIDSYVAKDITNPKTDKLFPCASKINISKDGEKYIYTIDFSNLAEELKSNDISYPKVRLMGDVLKYIEIGDIYIEEGLEFINSDDANSYMLEIENEDIDTSIVGKYIVSYNLRNKANDRLITLYRTIIVTE